MSCNVNARETIGGVQLFQVSGLSTWIGEQLGTFGHLPPLLLSLTLCFIVAGVTEFSSNAATTVLILPILAQLVGILTPDLFTQKSKHFEKDQGATHVLSSLT